MNMLKTLLNSAVFWSAWVLIPVLMEIVPSIGSLFVLAKHRRKYKKSKNDLKFYPEISVIVPVYNSAETLFNCIAYIAEGSYPADKIHLLLADNGSSDNSFEVYKQAQEKYPSLNMQWVSSEQGKSRAMNLALYNSDGKYIINIDSDGVLEPNALKNFVDRFEAEPDVNCMTGAVLTIPAEIKKHKGFFSRLLREIEFMEYAQAFLAGRSFASELSGVYTLSGAFSAFRKSAILSSQMYNTDTLSEDTQMTFQMRYLQHEKVQICDNAIFFTQPIESVNKLYTQRQRWQRGSLEVAEMFKDKDELKLRNAAKDSSLRTLVFDHTFAFPRFIWYLALIMMMYLNYSGRAVAISVAIIFALYIAIAYFYFISVSIFLKMEPPLRKYYTSHWWVVPLLPLFNLAIFFVRLAGIINSIGSDSSWKTRDLSEEKRSFSDVIKKDFSFIRSKAAALQKAFNKEPEHEKYKNGAFPALWYAVSGLIISLSAVLFFTVSWIKRTYGIGLNELVNTLGGNLQGTSRDVIIAVVKGCVLPSILFIALFIVFAIADRRHSEKVFKESSGVKKIGTVFSRALPAVCAVCLVFSLLFTQQQLNVLAYCINNSETSGIYEQYYVDPKTVTITSGEKKRNLIYIYLESMETTYASKEDGGAQEQNYIPELTKLAEENISFSDKEGLGGFHTVKGAGYTMAAMFATTTGVPYSLSSGTASTEENQAFASGITGLGDILEDEGYNQEFLCGSDAAFGGRKAYFMQHGDYEIFDLFSARANSYVPDDYYVWWGIEDSKLFGIAKDELLRLAAEDKPFNLTLLTVDLHHIGGYLCSECRKDFDVDTANVAACTSRQVAAFIDWCREQDFYKDTSIVITGDHPRMDTYLVGDVSYYDRTVYNTFINSAVSTENTREREYTHMDIFPTVLASMGFDIKGNRLGLGTNLFSAKKTLAEEIGFKKLDAELSKSSDYYVSHFAPELK